LAEILVGRELGVGNPMTRAFRHGDSNPDPRRDVRDELRFHLEERAKEFAETHGLSPDAAWRAAVDSFGDLAWIEAECRMERARLTRERRLRAWMQGVVMDVVYAVQSLRRSPAFAAAALLTLALGIGGAAAAFTVVNGVLIRPLPYGAPDRIGMLWMQSPDGGRLPFSTPNYLDLREWNRSFESVAAFRAWSYAVEDGGSTELVAGSRAAPELFATLGVKPHLGRTFTADESVSGAPPVAVIGYDLWQRRFAGSAGVIGRRVSINGERFEIIGVMAPGFSFPRGAELPAGLGFPPRSELWSPLVFSDQDRQLRGLQNLAVVGRLRPATTTVQASVDLARIATRLTAEHPRFFSRLPAAFNLTTLEEQAAAPVRRGLLLLLGAVGLVLLVACANVTNLLIARTSARTRELAVRTALGATRSRLARQLITENAVLSLGGAALGFALAVWWTRALIAVFPGPLPRADDIAVDWRVVLAIATVVVVSGAAFGIAASIFVGGGSATLGLNGTRSTMGRAERIGRRGLVVLEVALSLMLLAGAGLLGRSLARLQRVDPGFVPDRAVTAGLMMQIGSSFDFGRDGAQWPAIYVSYLDRVAKLPGVVAAGAVSSLPLSGAIETAGYGTEGEVLAPAQERPQAPYAVVTPGYFAAMAIPLRDGRTFDARDAAGGAPVVVVSESLARKHWPNESAVGKRLIGLGNTPVTIVGVVGDVTQTSLDTPRAPAIYFAVTQAPYPFLTVVVRTESDAAIVPELRRALREMAPALALSDVKTLRSVFDDSLARQRYSLLLVGAFAVAALVLALVGLYGVISYGVAQRTRELAVRAALGADRRGIIALVVGEGMRMTIVGLVVGFGGAVTAGRLLHGLLYEVDAVDLPLFIAMALGVAAVASLALLIPARRAARVDPIGALRGE
jgi:putative ABC transport system permease protein